MGIKPSEAKADIENTLSAETIDSKSESAEHKAEETKTHLDGLKAFYQLRLRWSWFVIGCIAYILAFNSVIILGVGLGWFHFISEWSLPSVIFSSLTEIIGLAIIVVKFLFDKPDQKLS